ncbi:MAG: acyl--CoA ligase, partial [Planctomycetales bacterium]|nr:acyl--CoA ligase [Planctomycetales bacterium]
TGAASTSNTDPPLIDEWGEVDATTFRDLVAAFEQQYREVCGKRIGLQLPANRHGMAALVAADQLGWNVFLIDELLDEDSCDQISRSLQLYGWLSPPSALDGTWRIHSTAPSADGAIPKGESSNTAASSVTILTSGTEGRPKAARHTWESLMRPVRCNKDGHLQRWLLAYRPHLYAGLQVILQSLRNRGTLVLPPAAATADEVVELLVRHRVNSVSATPSYWRRLLLFADRTKLEQAPIAQITIGGEIVDDALLGSLRATFPAARIVHIYATTELGRCFAVSDGRAGFPAAFLENATPDGVEMRIINGVLAVRSGNAMAGYDPHGAPDSPAEPDSATESAWFLTGDLVEQREDRVYFLGRRGDLINVGGNKVRPLAVESVVRKVPQVADVRVFPKSSSIAGQLVACQIVAAHNADRDALRAEVVQRCQQELPHFAVPRWIEFVEQIDLSAAGKTQRHQQ